MRQILLIAVLLAGSTGLVRATEVVIQSPQALRTYSSVQRMQPTTSPREEACDCCRKCQAAQRDIRPSHDGVQATNGCRDCCQRCGTDSNQPTDRHMIPEKVVPERRR